MPKKYDKGDKIKFILFGEMFEGEIVSVYIENNLDNTFRRYRYDIFSEGTVFLDLEEDVILE